MPISMSFDQLKKKALEKFFSRTNPMQKEAIFNTEKALLVIAGAGSGKTTVLCNRIANLLLFGKAYKSNYIPPVNDDDLLFLDSYIKGEIIDDSNTTERLSQIIAIDKAVPWSVLAVTFTNKAAGELKERLSKIGADAGDVWASTFHSFCVKMLRRGIETIGYKTGFTIYDTDDSLRLIKLCMAELGFTDKAFSPRIIQGMISGAKDKLIYPEEYDDQNDVMKKAAKAVYGLYQNRLKLQNALDFDDIIFKTVEMLRKSPEILNKWQNQFKYIMVDEYQDTNMAQYELISMLAKKHGNLCVVGDEDQSIYGFRGATIQNILSFEQQFSAQVIKLEQNYRSTGTILEAANAVIEKNSQRKKKHLWTDQGMGDQIRLITLSDEQSEGMFVANAIMDSHEIGEAFSENAILYRTNAQSRSIELALSRLSIPYKIIGGTRFYERREIKDILAYLSIINNPFDTIRLRRIINLPKRNIGEATQNEIERLSVEVGTSTIEIMERADEFYSLTKKVKALKAFASIYRDLEAKKGESISNLIDEVLKLSGYMNMLKLEGEEGQGRLQNIEELKSSAVTFMNENEDAGLSEFLEQIALISDLDSFESGDDKVVLMTIHSAKGLEFNNVYIVGMEENIFPSFRSVSEPNGLEEERRLAYVAITRAKRNLYITHVKQRLLYGSTQRNRPSRFLNEIPLKYIENLDRTTPVSHLPQKPEPAPGYLQSQSAPRALVIEKKVASLDYKEGERIRHRMFGDGTITSTTPMGNDTLLEIAFDRIGTKKIAANFAKVEKI